MIKLLRCIVFSLFFILPTVVSAIEVSVTTLGFYQEKPYLEIYSHILGHSVQFAASDQNDSLNYAQIEMLILIKQNQETIVADKLSINSPGSTSVVDFWDLRRYPLANGDYDLEIVYTDLNNRAATSTYTEKIVVNHGDHYISNSDIMIMKNISSEQGEMAFYRSGFSYEPAPYNLFGEKDSLFIFYTELYHLSESADLFYKYSVRRTDDAKVVMKPAYKPINEKENLQILQRFDISDLGTGNYQLNFEVINKSKEVLHQMIEPFSVYHPLVDYRTNMMGDSKYETSFVHLLDEGEVNYSLKAIFPRLTNNMTNLYNSIIWGDELEPKKYFLYSFWSGFSPDRSKEIYDKYMSVARAVDLEYASNVGHGFESDRGYFFLKYGRPDDVVMVEDEPSAPPYEIWIYNHLLETNQTAVKFLFYNPSIVANDFILLHSTCRGELTNPQWELELYKDDNLNNTTNNINNRTVEDGFNRNARRYFNDF